MTVTNRAVGEQVNLATILNGKLEAPILQSEMGLDTAATAIKQAVRYDEFSVKHNNDGTFKAGIIANADISATAAIAGSKLASTSVTATQIANGTITTTQISGTAGIVGTQLANSTVTATQIANTTITDAQISATAAIQATKLTIQKLYKKGSTANPSATANTDGTAVDLTPIAGYASLVPIAIDAVFAGTFGAETATATVTVTYSDTTTASVTKTATAAGTSSFSNADLMALVKDGVFINKISVKSKSTIASSTATVTFNHAGFYL